MHRRKSGMGTVELAITAIVGVLFSCLAIDLGLMMLGNQMLDRATRDAARAAAGQSTSAAAQQAATAALASHKADGYFVQTPTLIIPEFVYQDHGGTPEGQIIPPGNPNAGTKAGPSFVSVAAQTQVLLPANLSWLQGAVSLQQGPLSTGKMPFRRVYWFPIVKSRLNNAFQ